MNRLILIGNGFDLAHGLKTSYADFINWYWEQRLKKIREKDSTGFSDPLFSFDLKGIRSYNRRDFDTILARYEGYRDDFQTSHVKVWDYLGFSLYDDSFVESNVPAYNFISCAINRIKDCYLNIDPYKYPLMARIMQSVETKGWVDIENDYYDLLKDTVKDEKCTFTAKQLNDQLDFLKEKLAEYLIFINGCSNFNKEIKDKMNAPINLGDISITDWQVLKEKAKENFINNAKNYRETYKYPNNIKVLNFNYTPTALQYMEDEIFIHGSLVDSKKMIFGYGDEMDEDYKEIVNKNDNELLKYTKSVRYLESTNYSRVLEFMESDYFQVVIMGHSCGTSDRTLLNTIFEHPNCVSIKPYYYKKTDGTDNYLDIVQNIYRNFTDKKMYRDRVVCKDRCEPLIDKTVKKIKVR